MDFLGLRRAQWFKVLALQNQREWRLRTVLPKVQSLRTIISSFVCVCVYTCIGVCVCVCVCVHMYIYTIIYFVYVCAQSLSCVQLFAIPWAVAHQVFCPWYFPGKSTGVGCHFPLQGIFLTQGSNPDLLLGRKILYH